MIVVDTNVIVYFYLPFDQTEAAGLLLKSDPDWILPKLWRSEFRNVLALHMRKQLLSFQHACALQKEAELFISGREYEVTSLRVLSLANQSNCSAYDCEFVALAEQFGVPLVTADKRLAKAFPEQAILLENAVTSH